MLNPDEWRGNLKIFIELVCKYLKHKVDPLSNVQKYDDFDFLNKNRKKKQKNINDDCYISDKKGSKTLSYNSVDDFVVSNFEDNLHIALKVETKIEANKVIYIIN